MTEERRLYRHILTALDHALAQEDLEIARLLKTALELALTRGVGGPDFVERRQYPQEAIDILDRLARLEERAGESPGAA